jgi:hypothetical protein
MLWCVVANVNTCLLLTYMGPLYVVECKFVL